MKPKKPIITFLTESRLKAQRDTTNTPTNHEKVKDELYNRSKDSKEILQLFQQSNTRTIDFQSKRLPQKSLFSGHKVNGESGFIAANSIVHYLQAMRLKNAYANDARRVARDRPTDDRSKTINIKDMVNPSFRKRAHKAKTDRQSIYFSDYGVSEERAEILDLYLSMRNVSVPVDEILAQPVLSDTAKKINGEVVDNFNVPLQEIQLERSLCDEFDVPLVQSTVLLPEAKENQSILQAAWLHQSLVGYKPLTTCQTDSTQVKILAHEIETGDYSRHIFDKNIDCSDDLKRAISMAKVTLSRNPHFHPETKKQILEIIEGHLSE